jgi:hypothetical protein
MPDPISGLATAAYGFASLIWGYIKWPVKQAALALKLNKKVAELETRVSKLTEQDGAPLPYRKCPHCGERDMRLRDTYRYRESPLDIQRYFHEKWLCYSCGFREEVNLPEPGG